MPSYTHILLILLIYYTINSIIVYYGDVLSSLLLSLSADWCIYMVRMCVCVCCCCSLSLSLLLLLSLSLCCAAAVSLSSAVCVCVCVCVCAALSLLLCRPFCCCVTNNYTITTPYSSIEQIAAQQQSRANFELFRISKCSLDLFKKNWWSAAAQQPAQQIDHINNFFLNFHNHIFFTWLVNVIIK